MHTHVLSSRKQMLRVIPSPIMYVLLQIFDASIDMSDDDSVVVVIQLKLDVSIGIALNMYTVIQHSYLLPGSNPLIIMMLTFTFVTFTECICLSLIVVQIISYVLTFRSPGGVHVIVTEVESVVEMIFPSVILLTTALFTTACHLSLIHTSTFLR